METLFRRRLTDGEMKALDALGDRPADMLCEFYRIAGHPLDDGNVAEIDPCSFVIPKDQWLALCAAAGRKGLGGGLAWMNVGPSSEATECEEALPR